MRIEKTSETRPLAAHTVNAYSESESNAYSCDYVNGALTYSTDEVNTHKKWIDGKDIFRKVFNTTSPSTTGSETTIATIGSFDALVNIIANIDLGSYGIVPLPQMFGVNNINTLTIDGKTNGNIIMKIDNDVYKNKNVFIVVEYTKTTQSTRSLDTYSGDIEEKKDIVIDDGGEEKPIDEGNNENNK